ncbi:MAG TPA: 50S ribosomal protein L21 [Bdellovibrionota bacterium]|nr:50S ribosomal protein L21 [Bdellovibrionota bacterium]
MPYVIDTWGLIGHFPRTMYAVFETGSKQYRVQPGDVIRVEKLAGEVGASLQFNQVLFASKPGTGDAQSQVWIGKPALSGAVVTAEVLASGRGEKHVIVKRRRRTQYKRTVGHRQEQTELLVTALDNGAGEKASLPADQKKKIVDGYFSNLRAEGLAFTPKTLGSRVRLAGGKKDGPKESAEKSAAAPKTEKTEKAAPAKKAPAKKSAAKK